MKQDSQSRGAGVARGIFAIVATGVVLGLGFNALGRSGSPSSRLAWIHHEEPLARLEEIAHGTSDENATAAPETPIASKPSESSPPATGRAPASEKAPMSAPVPSAVARSVRSAGATPAVQADAASRPAPDAARGGSNPAPPIAASSMTEPPTPEAAQLPKIPDLDHPLQIELATLKKFYFARAAVIVDAREPEEYDAGHIPGAISIPFDRVFEDPTVLERFDPGGRPIISYCSGSDCDLSMQLARSMIDAGHKRVLVFEGGFRDWQAAGQPVARGPEPGVP